jgi:hypothetical protein
VALSFGTLAAAPAVSAQATSDDAVIPGIVDSSKLSTPDIVTGVIRTAKGDPASGAHVIAYAWPDVSKAQVGAASNSQRDTTVELQ